LLAGTNIGGANPGAGSGPQIYAPDLVHASECKHSWSFDHAVHGSGWLNDRVSGATMVLQGSATFDDAVHPTGGGIIYSLAGGSIGFDDDPQWISVVQPYGFPL
jgi:hypothetical protein